LGVNANRQKNSREFTAQSDYVIHSVTAIPLDHWFEGLLKASHFQKTTEVVSLFWGGQLPENHQINPNIIVRPMAIADLGKVVHVDKMAFQPLWQQTEDDLEKAFRLAYSATVIASDDEVVGYQISTPTQMGGHIARLAVLPNEQKKGYGYNLLCETLTLFVNRGIRNVTVNTQFDNFSSLSLYEKAGFRLTGDSFPVYAFSI
jgi:ribosomal protein S18 acetylase RimI-like enzyme